MGTTASPFTKLEWGRCTQKDRTLYLHIFDWPENGCLHVPGLITKVDKAYLLAKPDNELFARNTQAGVDIQLPSKPIDPAATVVVLELKEPAEVL